MSSREGRDRDRVAVRVLGVEIAAEGAQFRLVVEVHLLADDPAHRRVVGEHRDEHAVEELALDAERAAVQPVAVRLLELREHERQRDPAAHHVREEQVPLEHLAHVVVQIVGPVLRHEGRDVVAVAAQVHRQEVLAVAPQVGEEVHRADDPLRVEDARRTRAPPVRIAPAPVADVPGEEVRVAGPGEERARRRRDVALTGRVVEAGGGEEVLGAVRPALHPHVPQRVAPVVPAVVAQEAAGVEAARPRVALRHVDGEEERAVELVRTLERNDRPA